MIKSLALHRLATVAALGAKFKVGDDVFVDQHSREGKLLDSKAKGKISELPSGKEKRYTIKMSDKVTMKVGEVLLTKA